MSDKRTRFGELLFWWFLAALAVLLAGGALYLQLTGADR